MARKKVSKKRISRKSNFISVSPTVLLALIPFAALAGITSAGQGKMMEALSMMTGGLQLASLVATLAAIGIYYAIFISLYVLGLIIYNILQRN